MIDQSLSLYIRDPLYRLATWIIILQLLFIVAAAIISGFIRWLKPKLDAKRQQEETIARQSILKLLGTSSNQSLSEQANTTLLNEEAEKNELLDQVSIRSVINAFEQVVTRLGEVEQRRLRVSQIALKIEKHAQQLVRSWWWWRRFEGTLLLRSVGTESSENILVKLLHDPNPTVSFYAAWALARVSPKRGLNELLLYIETEGIYELKESKRAVKLSFSQQVTLLKELKLEYLEIDELETIFDQISAKLKPVLIEALIQSGRGLALPIVRRGIQSTDIEVRIASFKAAATSRLSLNEKELKRGLEDPIWPVRAQAAKAIGALQAVNLIPQLCKALADGQWWVRNNSAQSLVQLGSSGIEALSYISQFGEDRFARDIARLVLSEAVMSQKRSVLNALNTQPVSPIKQTKLSKESAEVLKRERSAALLTAEINALPIHRQN